MNPDYPHLRKLLGSAFYQGWKESGATADARLESYIGWLSHESLPAVAAELDAILARRLGPAELERLLLDELGCYHVPRQRDGGPARWLQQIRRAVRRREDIRAL